jgi:acetylornithine deacetylase/succinyl-diaminopimelate desuccinylase-like protein
MKRPLVALAVSAVCGCLAAAGTGAPSTRVPQTVARYLAGHEPQILAEFRDLLAIPNVASDRAHIGQNAEAIVAMLGKRGLRAELLEADGAPPAVLVELPAPGAKKTVVFYAHYDGQPVDPAQWSGAPWNPVLRDRPLEEGGRQISWAQLPSPVPGEWRLYARSAGDDKAPIIGFLAALDALRSEKIPRSVNLKFFFEGEEEAGSPHLEPILRKYADRLRSDLWILCDGPVHQTRRMQVFFGARGVTDVEMTVYGAARTLHSGHYGNWAPNPIAMLADLLAAMRDTDAHIEIPGFYDDVRPVTEADREALSKIPGDDAALERELGIGRTESPGKTLAEALLAPALNFRGISSGHVGAKAANAIPTEAKASIDFRLVPDQTPQKVRKEVEEFVQNRGFFIAREDPDMATRLAHPRIIKMVWGPGYRSERTPLDLPVSRAVVRVIEQATGGPIVEMPILGGSIPMYLFTDIFHTRVIGVPIANHDDNQHAANENLRLQNLWDGIGVYAGLFAELGKENW